MIFVLGFFDPIFVFVTKYVKKSKDTSFMKNVIVMMLVAFMLYASFGYNVKIEPHNASIYQSINSP